jgi:hypothetical protein
MGENRGDWLGSLNVLLQKEHKDKLVKYETSPDIGGFVGLLKLICKDRDDVVYGTYIAPDGPYQKKKDCEKAAARCCVEDLEEDWRSKLLRSAVGVAVAYTTSHVGVYYTGEVILTEASGQSQRFSSTGGPFTLEADAQISAAKCALRGVYLVQSSAAVEQEPLVSVGLDDSLGRVSQMSSVTDSERGLSHVELPDPDNSASSGNSLIDLMNANFLQDSNTSSTGDLVNMDCAPVPVISSPSSQNHTGSRNILTPYSDETHSINQDTYAGHRSHVVDLTDDVERGSVTEGIRDVVLIPRYAVYDTDNSTTRTFPEPPSTTRTFPEPPSTTRIFPEPPSTTRTFPEPPSTTRTFSERPRNTSRTIVFDPDNNYIGLILMMQQGKQCGIKKLLHEDICNIQGDPFFSSYTVSFNDITEPDKKFVSDGCSTKKASKKHAAFLAYQYVSCQRGERGNVATVHCHKCDTLLGRIVDFYFRCKNDQEVAFAHNSKSGSETIFRLNRKTFLQDGTPVLTVNCVNCLNILAKEKSNDSGGVDDRSIEFPSSPLSPSRSNNNDPSIGIVDMLSDKSGTVYVFGHEKITFKFSDNRNPITVQSWVKAMTDSIFSNVARVSKFY